MIIQTVRFMAVGRMVAWRENAKREDVECLFLYNDGRHIYVTDSVKPDGSFKWKRIRFAEFSVCPASLGRHTRYQYLQLRSHGHVERVAKVTVSQLMTKTYGKKNKEMIMKDWSMTFHLLPENVVFIHTVDCRTAEVSRVKVENIVRALVF